MPRRHTPSVCASYGRTEEVDRAPDGEAGTESDDEGLEDINGRVKEIHNIVAGINLMIVK